MELETILLAGALNATKPQPVRNMGCIRLSTRCRREQRFPNCGSKPTRQSCRSKREDIAGLVQGSSPYMLRTHGAYATERAVLVLGDNYMFLAHLADYIVPQSAPVPSSPNKGQSQTIDKTTNHGQEPWLRSIFGLAMMVGT